MEITEVEVQLVSGHRYVRATCNVVLDGAFTVHDVKVVEGTNGLFVSEPAQRVDGRWQKIFHPVTEEARRLFHGEVLKAYQDIVALSPSQLGKGQGAA